MAYIPDGWTAERLREATAADLEQLPHEVLQKIDANAIESPDARAVVSAAQTAQEPGVALQQAPRKTLAQVVNGEGFDDFGFLVIRTGYGDDVPWDEWADEFSNLMERDVVQSAGADGLIDKLMMAMIDDPELHRASWGNIQGFFEDCYENDMVPSGLDVGFCLAVDKDAMNSLLHPKSGEEPWVWAVDTDYDFAGVQGQDLGDAYPGYFKVAVSSIMTDFYPTIAGPGATGEELWPAAKPVWPSTP